MILFEFVIINVIVFLLVVCTFLGKYINIVNDC